jgi:ubiquinone/menaquinone biosynthesis C-methylase UbiE
MTVPINPEVSGARLPDLYRMDETNGWAQGMRHISVALLAKQPIIKGPFLDLGCGSGMFVHELAAARPQALVLGADLSSTALAYAAARSSGERLLQVDIGSLPLAPASVGLVTALDSFDQVGVDIDRTLAEAYRVLRPGALLLVRVSAHPWLWGPHDVAFNTGRRWRLGDLVDHVQDAGFTVERTTYANSLLSPLLVTLRLLQKWGWAAAETPGEEQGWTNSLLRRTLDLEGRWLEKHRFPFGISAYILAQVPKQRDLPVYEVRP